MASNPLAPPPPSGDEMGRWLFLLWKRLTATGQILWDTISFTGSNITDIETRNHADLQNLNTASYTHLTAANHTDLTDGGDTTLHQHSSVTVADESADTTCFPLFAPSATGNVQPKTNAALTYNASTNELANDGNFVLPKVAGEGVKVDPAAPTFGWRDLLGAIIVKGSGGGGAEANPDYVVYRGGLYAYRFGTNAPNKHDHEAFIEYHIPHDYVPGTDLFLHVHWSQTTVDTGGAAGVPGVAKWYFEVSYATGHGTPGGAADPFVAPITVSVTQQASTTQYGHMIAEVQFTNSGGTGGLLDSANIEVDGLVLVRVSRDPVDAADTLNQDTFVHFVDIHYQSTNMATKQKSPDFYT